MKHIFLKVIIFFMSAVGLSSCYSPKTPDFSHTENESSNPEGQRTSDSNRYDGVVTDTVSKNSREGKVDSTVLTTSRNDTMSSQRANDSTSGSRISSDGNDLRNNPSPDSKASQSQSLKEPGRRK